MEKYKILLLGNDYVGKSSLIYKFKNNIFLEKYYPTIGLNISQISINNCSIDIWSYNKNNIKEYYINSDACILMCDINNISKNSIHDFYYSIINICGLIPIILLFNKIDKINKEHFTKIYKDVFYKKYNLHIVYTSLKNDDVYNIMDNILKLIKK